MPKISDALNEKLSNAPAVMASAELNAGVKVYKGRDGWQAESNFDIGDGRTLKLSTWKASRGGVAVNAQVVEYKDDGTYSFVIFQDFSKTVYTVAGKCTEKSVRAAHSFMLGQIDSLVAEAKAFYAAKKGGE